MSILLREVHPGDLKTVFDLAETFSLLNLPPDEKVISDKITLSVKSFRGELPSIEECEYMFVAEDTEAKRVVGTSLIIAKHGTEEFPHIYFDVRNKERYSKELGVGFIHQVLKLCYDPDGPTEIGALLVHESYRRRPEKVGKQISLIRFLYMGMFKNRFENRILCELTPPLTADGRSEFWEALGRKFTGLPYMEADFLSRQNKEFIQNLFPEEEIYTCVLDAKARYVIGRVGLSTLPAKHLLESIGFKYLNQIDPFDGGPHYGAKIDDITVVKKTKTYELASVRSGSFHSLALVGVDGAKGFRACMSYFDVKGKSVVLPESTKALLDVVNGDTVFLSPISEGGL